ncbi:hypothetical protein [Neoroseomonas rubea]|uniref:hypothetical protein n=1 Tax=Neoroseomonas rubea TaxID=2748666 RepID=UPI0018DFD92B|nr:hypothetical protein [Roseomonas rubea]
MSKKKPLKVVDGRVGVPIDIDGVLYANFAKAGEAYPHIGAALIGERYRSGRRGLALVAPRLPGNARAVTIDGKEYPSLKAAAAALGHRESTLHTRLAKGQTDELLRKPVSAERPFWHPVEYQGVTYPSRRHFAKAFAPAVGLSPDLIMYRLKEGLSPDAALQPKQHDRPPQAISYQGREFPSRRAFLRHVATMLNLPASWGDSIGAHHPNMNPEQVVEAAKQKAARAKARARQDREALTATLAAAGFQGENAVRDFCTSLVHRHGVTETWVRQQIREGVPIATILRTAADPVMSRKALSLPVSVFGWRFASGEAAMRYFDAKDQQGIRDLVIRGRAPLYDCLRQSIVALGAAGMLRDDLRRKNEAGIRRAHLPENVQQYIVEDQQELRALELVRDAIRQIVERDRAVARRLAALP